MLAKTVPKSRRSPVVQKYREIDDFSQKGIQIIFLLPDNFFVQPALLPAAKDDQAVFLQYHDFAGPVLQLPEFHFRDFAFKHWILNPVQVSAAQFEHFAHSFFADIVN